MVFGITGGTGFLGKTLQQEIVKQGHQVILFSRHPSALTEVRQLTPNTIADVSACDILINLAGEPILGLWTEKKRTKILESRVHTTRSLLKGIAHARTKPTLLINASAIGYYGDCSDQLVDEEAPAGQGFLTEVTTAWEKEALRAEEYGVRVVLLRLGLVLDSQGKGGVMRFISPIFRYGLGGEFGSGSQWMSCIAIQDVVGLLFHCLKNQAIHGPVNAVMPHPITNANFTKRVAASLHRPAFFHIPAWLLRTILGEFSHLFLDSQRIIPSKALQSEYQFQYPSVEEVFKKGSGHR